MPAKRTGTFLFVPLVVVAVVGIVAFQGTRSFAVDGIAGGDSYQSTIAHFPGATFREVTRNIMNDGVRPLFDERRVKATNTKLLGASGTVILDFYNDRLMGIVFYPANFAKAKPFFIKELGGKGEARNWRFIAGVNSTRRCIVWRDKFIQKQSDNWVDHYS